MTFRANQSPISPVTSGSAGISNGDTIIITGELKGDGGAHYRKGDFWVKSVKLAQ